MPPAILQTEWCSSAEVARQPWTQSVRYAHDVREELKRQVEFWHDDATKQRKRADQAEARLRRLQDATVHVGLGVAVLVMAWLWWRCWS
jgi:hypothetical protein